MGELPLWTRLKLWIGGIAWRVFLWANETSEGDYWSYIYEQERARLRGAGKGTE